MSFPLRLVPVARKAHLLLSDIWLYYYSNNNYTGLVKVIFETITKLQIIKFDFFEKFLGWNHYKSYLSLSSYFPYTNGKFVEVEGASSALLDSNFTYFVYTVPQNILFCLSLMLMFYLLKNYRISKVVRKFYFIKTALGVALLEMNLAYFTFVCFTHLNQSFSFCLWNKL